MFRAGGRQARWASFLLWTLLFGVAYTQPPLYYSNQNQYFLHGLAEGGFGFLDEDWLANTTDPTPAFSKLVDFTYRHLHPAFFYVYFVFLLGVYFHALVGIHRHLNRDARSELVFMTILLSLHSGLLRWGSAQLFSVDYPWYLQAGVANQYVLGAGLQPSVFGVLLVLSIATFLRDRPYLAVTWSLLGAVMHSTYLLPAAILTLAYGCVLCRQRRFFQTLAVGLWALFVVSPVVIYNLASFGPSSSQTFAESQRLLAHFRIPHHAEVDRWLDGIAWGQIGWVVLATWLVRGSRLFGVLAVSLVLSVVLTFVQLGTKNDTLALLFPWRISAVLVPVATAVILARLVNLSSRLSSLPGTAPVMIAIVAAAVVGGVIINYFELGYRTNTQEIGLLRHIQSHKTRGDVYLLPIEVPKLTAGKRGAASLNFTPPPRRDAQDQVISVDLQRFRLFTGAPIYIDFKSIPYKDVEVLEWHRRVLWNQQFYEQADWNRAGIIAELRRVGITHVVTTRDSKPQNNALELLYADDYYRLYQLKRR